MHWNEVQYSIALDLQSKDLVSALRKVNSFLAAQITPEIRSSALGMKAELEEELGQLENAKQTLLSARGLVGPGFGKYVHEFCLAGIFRKQGEIEKAISWYRTALKTSVESDGVSSGSALNAFLTLNGETLTAKDYELCVQAVQRSWRILGLIGEPEITDLAKAVSKIREREARGPQ